MSLKVCKFGGTSMADGTVIKKVKTIIESDKDRRYIVVSAPGKRYSGDTKVTDMLYRCYDYVKAGKSCQEPFSAVRVRYESIVRELGLDMDITPILDETQARIDKERDKDFTASRGEYLCAKIVAKTLDAQFLDAEDVVFFNEDGTLNGDKSYQAIAQAIQPGRKVVMPGFYGKGVDGKVKTFSRGGSDISGAVLARAVNAGMYENWTDVSGFLACDPRIVNSPKQIRTLSYKELRELSYMGANVLHSESIFPVRRANIPINIRNTFRPEDEGTLILPISRYVPNGNIVTGIAGKKDFTVIYIEKSLMNAEIGFARKILTILEKLEISLEHMPTGIDTLSLVIESSQLQGFKLEQMLEMIKDEVEPDVIRVMDDIALVATVGHGMSSSIGTSARLFKALGDAEVSVKLIDEGSSELNVIVGVKNDDLNKCISAIYYEFFN